MNTYFRIDANGFFNGVDMFDVCPKGWIDVRPPTFDHMTEQAHWDGTSWIISLKTAS